MGGRMRRLVVRGCGGRLVACIGRRSRGRLRRRVRRWGVGGVVAFGLWWTLCPFDDLLPTLRPLSGSPSMLRVYKTRRTANSVAKSFRLCRAGAQQCCAPTLLLGSPICQALLFALLRACRRCVGLLLVRLGPWALYRLRLGRRLLLAWSGRVHLPALLFQLLRRGRVRDQSRAKRRSRGLLCGRASPGVLRRDAESWARASPQGFRECAWRFGDECPFRGAPFQAGREFRCRNP